MGDHLIGAKPLLPCGVVDAAQRLPRLVLAVAVQALPTTKPRNHKQPSEVSEASEEWQRGSLLCS